MQIRAHFVLNRWVRVFGRKHDGAFFYSSGSRQNALRDLMKMQILVLQEILFFSVHLAMRLVKKRGEEYSWLACLHPTFLESFP